MVRFELKKVFSRFKNKMAVVILCVNDCGKSFDYEQGLLYG